MSVRERILARIDAEPDGVPLTKLLRGLPIPSGAGRYKELRAMLIEKLISGGLRGTLNGRPPIYFRRATAARADS